MPHQTWRDGAMAISVMGCRSAWIRFCNAVYIIGIGLRASDGIRTWPRDFRAFDTTLAIRREIGISDLPVEFSLPQAIPSYGNVMIDFLFPESS